MSFQLITPDPMSAYLESTDVIDFHNERVLWLVEHLGGNELNSADYIESVFTYLRDIVPHTWDIQRSIVTLSSIEVATHGTGICYSKAHLAAALLRAKGIPSGLCYQRIKRRIFKGSSNSHCIHALPTVYDPQRKAWYRIDCRGSRPGYFVEYEAGRDCLAFTVVPEDGEVDYPTNYSSPPPEVLFPLETYTECKEMYAIGLPLQLNEAA